MALSIPRHLVQPSSAPIVGITIIIIIVSDIVVMCGLLWLPLLTVGVPMLTSGRAAPPAPVSMGGVLIPLLLLFKLLPLVVDDAGVKDVAHLRDDVELTEDIMVVEHVDLLLHALEVPLLDIDNVIHPVIDETEGLLLERGHDAAAAVVPGEDDMLHVEVFDGVL